MLAGSPAAAQEFRALVSGRIVDSTGAAISNAVANAIGVRVPELPLTADRVLAALEKGRAA